MKILLVHNTYQQSGGEDVVFQAEKELLENYGHTVILYQRSNHEPGVAKQALWSDKTYREVQALIRATHPDLAHFHNTFLAVSPSAYYACQDAGVPVVQTLHNFRLICPNGLLLRKGKICEVCIGHTVPWRGVLHACWRGSRAGSMLVASMLTLHHALGTWIHKVDRYIALTEFSRQKFIQGGLPAAKIAVKPNFIPDPGLAKKELGSYVLFVGRFSIEKGIDTLLEAWQHISEIPLKMVGDGPLYAFAKEKIAANSYNSIELMGGMQREAVFQIMHQARFVVVPSKLYENFSIVVLEAFALGTPLIVPSMGNLGNIVVNGKTGCHFATGNAQDLAAKIIWLWNNPAEVAHMGQNARREYAEKYTPQENYRQLMDIYAQVVKTSP